MSELVGPSIQIVEADGVIYVARVIDGQVHDLSTQRTTDTLLQNTVLIGRVSRTLGNGALVDIGRAAAAPLPNAGEIGEGAIVPVQLTSSLRAMRDGKMPPLARDIALPGRYLLHRPLSTDLAFSRRISKSDRHQWPSDHIRTGKGGWLIRAAAIDQPSDKVQAEADHLRQVAEPLHQSVSGKRPGDVLLAGPTVWQRALFDEPELASVQVQPGALRQKVITWLKSTSPDLVTHVWATPPEELLTLLDDLDRLLVPQVALADGASLWIEPTRAMVSVDVDAPLDARPGMVNRQAAESLARHIRLRNLGGLIGVDFLRLGKPPDRRRVLEALRSGLESHQSGSAAQLHFAPDFSPVGPYILSRQRRGCALEDVIDGTDE